MAQGFDSGSEDSEILTVSAGTIVGGKYRIEGLIGRGGMGSVWAATHVSLGQRVAIKLISQRYASSREARQRFDLEAKAAAQLRSRFVVQVYDNGETPEGIPYIVMELLEGESLDQRITRTGPVGVADAGRILSEVGRALSKAHQLGIVHRDLKPENIFLARSSDDDTEIAKVLDFGIAKFKASSNDQQSGTRTGAVIGTPLFMSPEQARGLRSVDHRTDIYSLGMVAYTMLTGQAAFSGESFADLLVAICTQPLPPLLRIASWLPPGLEGWFQKACNREADQRFQSAQELVDAFQAAAGLSRISAARGEPIHGDSGPRDGLAPVHGFAPAGQGTGPGLGPQAPYAAAAQSAGPAGSSGPATTGAVELFEPTIPTRSTGIWLAAAGIALVLIGGAVWGLTAAGGHPHERGEKGGLAGRAEHGGEALRAPAEAAPGSPPAPVAVPAAVTIAPAVSAAPSPPILEAPAASATAAARPGKRAGEHNASTATTARPGSAASAIGAAANHGATMGAAAGHHPPKPVSQPQPTGAPVDLGF